LRADSALDFRVALGELEGLALQSGEGGDVGGEVGGGVGGGAGRGAAEGGAEHWFWGLVLGERARRR
jgi:hypothetical protein